MRIRRLVCAAVVLLAMPVLALAVDPALRKKAKDESSFKRSDAARELARDGSPDAAKLLVDLLQDRNVYTRDHTVVACGKLREPKSIQIIAKLAKSSDETVRGNVAEALGRTKQPAALPFLAKLAGDKKAPVRALALDGLWGFQGNEEAAKIATKALGDKDVAVRAAAVEAIGRMRAEEALALTEAVIADEDEDVGVRCVAWMEMPFLDREKALARLPEAAADPSWRIRAQAVDSALYLRDAAAVEVLVGRVADETVRVSAAAHRALKQLTGKQLGRDAELWKSWWEQAGKSWKAPEGDLPEPGAAPRDGSTSATYHGVEVTSKAFVFVIDASGSMRNKDFRAKDRSRWDLAVEELEKTVDALPDGIGVNVILFQESVMTAFPRIRPLSKKTRKGVKTFLRRTSPRESGDLLAGVTAALALDDVDTVYLLSDGAPSAGDLVDKGRVRRAIRQINRRRKIALHSIGFGARKKSEQTFLAGVSRDAGGIWVFLED